MAGFTLPLRLDPNSEYRVALTSSSTASFVLVALWSRDIDDVPQIVNVATISHSAGDRTRQNTFIPTGGGVLWGLWTSAPTGVRRGQMWVEVGISKFGVAGSVARGYISATHGLMGFEFENSLDGRGYLDWVQDGNDVAGSTDTTINLAATNARRVYRGLLVKYHSDGNAATRTIIVRLRDVGDTSGPTGFSIDEDVWESPTLTLTANEEGILYITRHGFVSLNDAGTITYADNTTAPNPFPIEVEDGETGDLIIDISSGQAGDDYDVFTKIEEWIEV